ncbi:FtsX-like permease family protein [Spirosoma taeanense]|uniref:FtsX-like permease family protein n=1 Tax=Spirosoma taeanense TaxID=2735870 RepID=A0A6M5YEQ1_9BACT|nr:ABC transporter permease [Spirosoma taeanense]QJW91462.1 FtsX-like permease family protein [Spirosoma taeanense]
MLYNYVKIAVRKLWRAPLYSLLNTGGLALGIAAFLLILEYISFERSYNQFHTQLPTLYRVLMQNKDGDVWTDMAPALAPLGSRQFSDVRAFCRVAESAADGIVTYGSGNGKSVRKSFRESDIAYADGSFFTLFSFPVLRGRAAAALNQPNTVAISATQARKYFGNDEPVGQILTLNNQFGQTPYTVSAVYADMPANSDLRFDMVFSLETLANPANLNGNSWARLDAFDGSYVTTFLALTPDASYQSLTDNFNAFWKKQRPDDQNRILLQPATNMHLAASLSDPYRTTGNLGFVYLLGGIAVLILAIAWFNYINLSTAGALKRAKEVGVRKVVGAGQGQLISQFLGESTLLNAAGFGLALLLVGMFQGLFNQLVQKELSLAILMTNQFWLLGLGLLVVGALASGGYTAFVLSSFQPIHTLKNASVRSTQGGLLRQTLVVFQFAVSVILIIGTVVLYRQLLFMQNQNLGLSLAQRVVIKGPEVGKDDSFRQRAAALQHDLDQLPYITNVSNTGIVPGNSYNFTASGITRQNPRPDDEKKGYAMGIIDDRFLTTYSIALAAGANFTPAQCDAGWEKSAKVMVNERAVRQLGFASAQAAVGQIINWGKPYEIVGVVKDYHHQSLREVIEPVIFLPRSYGGNLTVQLATSQMQAKLSELERLYKASFPGNPFEFFFVDEQYNQQYQAEQQYGRIFTTASLLAIFLACLGLFGLATYATEQRTKEIGVRKVLGASVGSIVALLSTDFLRLVLIAILIASPLAWYAMHRWLQEFAYKIDLAWWMFAGAGLLAIGIALLTIGFRSVKAALANPVNSLRTE